MTKRKITILTFLAMFLPSVALAWSGKVVAVTEGDTITVMHKGKGEQIRLYGVDCPESQQDFGTKSKQFTSDHVFRKTVDVKLMDKDRYGRAVGIVTYGRAYLNVELIRAGLAWVDAEYCQIPECQEWRYIEARAKAEKKGLWSMPNPTPPWELNHPSKKSGGPSPEGPRLLGPPEKAPPGSALKPESSATQAEPYHSK